MHVRLIRHATMQIEFAGIHLLVDPMLAEPDSYRSLTFGATAQRNPTVPLPVPASELLSPDAVIVTHTHFDHFDDEAVRCLPKASRIFGQPSDETWFSKRGFTAFQSVGDDLTWGRIKITRIAGKHGRGILARAMGGVSGFVLEAEGEPTVFLAGDSVWCPSVGTAIEVHRPDVVIVNAGAARLNVGGPITMDARDVIRVCEAAPSARVVAVHMEAINHCRLKRAELSARLAQAGVADRVCIPEDGTVAL